MKNEHAELAAFLKEISKNLLEKGYPSYLLSLEHQISIGINTVEEFKHEEAQSVHYDFYKSVHNIKPRWIQYSSMTSDEIWGMVKELEREQEAMIEQEKEQEKAFSQMVQKRKAKNKYQPNLAFSELKNLILK